MVRRENKDKEQVVMKDLYIIGGGGFASEVLFVIERIQQQSKKWNNIFVVDDTRNAGDKIRTYEIKGDIDYLIRLKEDVDAVLTINSPAVRRSVVEKIKKGKENVSFPNIFDTSSIIDDEYLSIGEGNVIMHYVVLSTHLTIGNFNMFNSYTGIGHDTVMGDFNSFNPRVAISGRVTIGNENSFGLCSSVLQNKSIGSNNDIWLNTAILKNIKDGMTYFGSPAKKIDL